MRVGPRRFLVSAIPLLVGKTKRVTKIATFFGFANCLLLHAQGMTGKLPRRSILTGLALTSAGLLWAEASPLPFSSDSNIQSLDRIGRSLTVAFWNIQWFPGGHPNPSHTDELRQTSFVHADMARLNPDILGMEEVRDFKSATLAVRPLRGFKVDVCANFAPREGQNEAQEVAIASRLQPLSAWAEQWKPNGAIVPPRGFAFASYQIGPDRLLLFYAVHLKSNLGELEENAAIREESMRQLRLHMTAMQHAYGKLGRLTWVIGGDCNTSLDSKQFAVEMTLRSVIDSGFAWCWRNIPPSSRVTLPSGSGFPPACFDHIFVRGATIRRAWVLNSSRQSSDHRPVAAILDF